MATEQADTQDSIATEATPILLDAETVARNTDVTEDQAQKVLRLLENWGALTAYYAPRHGNE